MGFQALIRAIYPPQCISCNALVASDFGLCADCWRDTPFINGLVCDGCGVPLLGETIAGQVEHCDDCLHGDRSWGQGRAAMMYRANGRRLILQLKHGDRMDLARPAAEWLRRAAQPLVQPDMLVAPVPLFWWRLFTRRYNQAALLSSAFAKSAGLAHCPDLLERIRQTGSQEGRSRLERFEGVRGAFAVPKRRLDLIQGRRILLVDDVLTSGATFHAASLACLQAGALSVSVLALARVAQEV